MKTIVLRILMISLFISHFGGCKKDSAEIKPKVKISIGDARVSQLARKGDAIGIINPAKLTKYEVTFGNIYLKNATGDYVSILNEPASINLRDFKGTVKELLPVEISSGTYSALKIVLTGVAITYDGNQYSASTSVKSKLVIGSLGNLTLTEDQGIPNPIKTEITIEYPVSFSLVNPDDPKNIRIQFDAESSCGEITYVVPGQNITLYFAECRAFPEVKVIPEEGIQQVKHSPPLGVQPLSLTNIAYYGIHTFVDFNAKGGTISSHTSQHVFRGEDGSLLIDAETMEVNTNTLIPTAIQATGETNVRADEVFKTSVLKSNLAVKGYTLVSGKKYYFSLRKIWNITSNGNTYNLTRLCEPIPVSWP